MGDKAIVITLTVSVLQLGDWSNVSLIFAGSPGGLSVVLATSVV
jgi:hypothetical protein